ncbi:MAG: UbiA prenyltransferase family protein [Anaerolineae bacterium]|nr:UbiA prenyltransferase family protein [Anaerolineae bacterium]
MQPVQPNRLSSLIRLTRWREHLPFTVPLTAVGALLAHRPLDWRLLAVIAANCLAVSYAFMINDIEDALDDALEPERAARNAITCGEISPRAGWAFSTLIVAGAVLLFALCGAWTLGIGGTTLLLSHTYSWRRVRLKAWPVVDVISHGLMLGGLLILAGHFAYNPVPGWGWLPVFSIILFSVYGQLYNQIRDYEMDKAAGLKNTAILVGLRITRFLVWGCVATGVLLLIVSLVFGVFPWWFAVLLVTLFGVVMVFRRQDKDMRDGAAADASGLIQVPFLVAANTTVAVWLGQYAYLLVGAQL